jgi:hypothetical protein
MVSLVMAAFQITEAFMKELKKIRSRKWKSTTNQKKRNGN